MMAVLSPAGHLAGRPCGQDQSAAPVADLPPHPVRRHTPGGGATLTAPLDLPRVTERGEIPPPEVPTLPAGAGGAVQPAECTACDGDGEVHVGSSVPGDEGFTTCMVCGGSGAQPDNDAIWKLREQVESLRADLDIAAMEQRQLQEHTTARAREAEGASVELVEAIRILRLHIDARYDCTCTRCAALAVVLRDRDAQVHRGDEWKRYAELLQRGLLEIAERSIHHRRTAEQRGAALRDLILAVVRFWGPPANIQDHSEATPAQAELLAALDRAEAAHAEVAL